MNKRNASLVEEMKEGFTLSNYAHGYSVSRSSKLVVNADLHLEEDLVANVLKMIDENPAKQHDFEAFAQKEGITLNYFRMLFKEETGMTPVNYLNKVRILKALELLQTTDLSIAEISAVIGIYDANYFSRLFKKVTGSPPRYFKAIATAQSKEGN